MPEPAGNLFFALVDEFEGSDRRLDEIAAPLLLELRETELAAAQAVEARRAKLGAVREYINRMHGVTAKLEEGNAKATNGGPSLVAGSAASPPPSIAPSPPPAPPSIDAPIEPLPEPLAPPSSELLPAAELQTAAELEHQALRRSAGVVLP